MNCPIDGTPLLMTERQGIEIDYCPQCRGVWLDRGELDKLIERSLQVERAVSQPLPDETTYPEKRKRESGDYEAMRRYDDDDDDYRKRRRGGFLGDIFDIFD